MKKYFLNIIGTTTLLFLIFYLIDIGKAVEVILQSDWFLVFLAAVTYFLLNIVLAMRIQYVLAKLGHKIDLFTSLKAQMGGMLASDFTPARSGYFLSSFILSSKKKIPIEKSMFSIFGPQLLEFLLKIVSSLVLIAWLIIFYQGFQGAEHVVVLTFIALTAVVMFFSALLIHPSLLETFSFVRRIRIGRKVFALFSSMRANSSSLKGDIPFITGFTVLAWLIKAVEWYLLARALGITIIDPISDFGFLLLFHSFGTLIHFLPIPTIAGAGLSEAALAAILLVFGVPADKGIAFGFLTRFLMIFVNLSGAPVISSILKKKKISDIYKQIENIDMKLK